jgi:hypothetical protein
MTWCMFLLTGRLEKVTDREVRTIVPNTAEKSCCPMFLLLLNFRFIPQPYCSTVLQERKAFVHFLSGLLQCEPDKRWSPDHALRHPFITGLRRLLYFERLILYIVRIECAYGSV